MTDVFHLQTAMYIFVRVMRSRRPAFNVRTPRSFSALFVQWLIMGVREALIIITNAQSEMSQLIVYVKMYFQRGRESIELSRNEGMWRVHERLIHLFGAERINRKTFSLCL